MMGGRKVGRKMRRGKNKEMGRDGGRAGMTMKGKAAMRWGMGDRRGEVGRRDKERKVTKKDGWGVLHAPPKSHPMEAGGGGSRNGFHGDSWFLVAWHVGY